MAVCSIMSSDKFEATFPEIHHQVCEELGMGFVPDIFRCVAAANPDLAISSWNMVRKNLCAGKILRTTKELMFSYIAHKKGCNYCDIAHHALALHYGFTEENISKILNDINEVRNPVLRVVLKLADFSVDNRFDEVAILDEELIELGFTRDEITELVGMVSCALYMVNIADSLGIDADKEFKDVIENIK
ncbi:MAG: hypothetical protein COB23_08095 [Methylophaga sp.]|nr:MAG: hypothetical protein COB23_08095 [Methylophaga sp.]